MADFSPLSPERTLEELLDAGEVEHALLLKGEFTDAERELVQRSYGIGRESMRPEVEALREELAAARKEREDFEQQLVEANTGLDALELIMFGDLVGRDRDTLDERARVLAGEVAARQLHGEIGGGSAGDPAKDKP